MTPRDASNTPQRDWTVLLIGGASRAGKSTLSLALAEHFDVRAVEGDLFFWFLHASTTAETEPDLHVFSQPGIWDTSPQHLASALLGQARRVTPGAEGVVARQVRIGEPLIIEAIWVLPEFALLTSFNGQPVPEGVRSLYVYEPDLDSLRERLSQIGPRGGWDEAREKRLLATHAYGLEIARRAEALGLPVLESRPFDTLLDRALSALTRPSS